MEQKPGPSVKAWDRLSEALHGNFFDWIFLSAQLCSLKVCLSPTLKSQLTDAERPRVAWQTKDTCLDILMSRCLCRTCEPLA